MSRGQEAMCTAGARCLRRVVVCHCLERERECVGVGEKSV